MGKSLLLAACLFLYACAATQKAARPGTTEAAGSWTLIFEDDFNTPGVIDSSKWSYCQRTAPPWARFLTPGPDYAFVGDSLVLRMDNRQIPGDAVPYHSGGIESRGKFS